MRAWQAAAIVVLLAVPALPSGAEAQTLAEIARRERERRAETPRGRVFTNESIRNLEAALGDDSEARAEAVSPADALPAPNPAGSAGGRTEAQWREAFAQLREELARAEQRATLAQQQLDDLNHQLLTRSDIYNREYRLGPEIEAKEGELAALRARVEAAREAIEDLRQELRRAGGPPGWARP